MHGWHTGALFANQLTEPEYSAGLRSKLKEELLDRIAEMLVSATRG